MPTAALTPTQLQNLPLVKARNFTPGPRTKGAVRLIVVHDMEAPEKGDTAENVARWFAGPTAPEASAHYCVDADSIVRCVRDEDIAWHAPGANSTGIGIELAGYARQGRGDWLDAYSKRMLDTQAIPLIAALCRKHGIPAVWLTPQQVAAGKAGICGHIDVTKAFPGKGSHVDPGPGFPRDYLIAGVKAALKVKAA